MKWTCPEKGEKDIYDPDAWLFSLTYQTFHNPLPGKATQVLHSKNSLATFGESNSDIWIANDCNTVTKSHSNLGHSFQTPIGLKYKEDITYSYLAGNFEFRVTEIEVFLVLPA